MVLICLPYPVVDMLKWMRFFKIIFALSRFLLIQDSHHDIACL